MSGQLPWLKPGEAWPSVDSAIDEVGGLLAAGADLSEATMISAYSSGIFPWFNENQPILWWSPDPRAGLAPSEFKISRSLSKELRNREHRIQEGADPTRMVSLCAATPRAGQKGTWVESRMRKAYADLAAAGWLKSVEVIIDGQMVGGLFGLQIGKAFFGESMVSLAPGASKFALARLALMAPSLGIEWIDCQMSTEHLLGLGAREISRAEHVSAMSALCDPADKPSWPSLDLSKERWDAMVKIREKESRERSVEPSPSAIKGVKP